MTLEIKDLCFSFDGTPLLTDVSLTVGRGEVVCLLGPNGAGKTTLLDCVMGFLRPSSGSILVDGKELRSYSRPALAEKLSYVPQLHHPSFPYSVREIVKMGCTAAQGVFALPKAEHDARADAALERVGLLRLADRPYTTLSGGELKLVLLARALVQNAPLMVLDEPTSSLDFRNETVFLETLASLARQEGIGVLTATHSLQHAFFFESRSLPVKAVMLQKGRPPRVGTPEELITAQTLREIYGVHAAIGEIGNESGERVKTVVLFGAGEEEKKR